MAAIAPLVLVAERTSPSLETVWSPYQKLELLRTSEPDAARSTRGYRVLVNNTTYQVMRDLSSPVHAGPEALASGSSASTTYPDWSTRIRRGRWSLAAVRVTTWPASCGPVQEARERFGSLGAESLEDVFFRAIEGQEAV